MAQKIVAQHPIWNPLLSIGGVACNIYTGEDGQDGHLVEAVPEKGGDRATVRIICSWANRYTLRAALLGTVGYQDGQIVRTPPFQYPLNVIEQGAVQNGTLVPSRLFATAITEIRGIKWQSDPSGGFTGLAGWGQFLFAVLTVEFTSPPYLVQQVSSATGGDLVGLTYATSEIRLSGEVVAPPTGSYTWAAGEYKNQEVKDAHVGFTRPRNELSVTRIRLPLVPYETITYLVGTVNALFIPVGAHQVSPHAALFLGANPHPYSDPVSRAIVYDVELLWLLNGDTLDVGTDLSWNYFLDPAGQWNLIQNSNDASTPFLVADHNPLFSNAIS